MKRVPAELISYRKAESRSRANREGTFEPRLIVKHERRAAGSDDKVLGPSARGMTVREIQAFLGEMYAVEVSPDLIRTAADAAMARSRRGNPR